MNPKFWAAITIAALLFWSCKDTYQRVGPEALAKNYPQGVAYNFELTYTEAVKEMASKDSSETRVVAILTGPLHKDFDNLDFKHKEFPEGLFLEFYDGKNQKSTVKADYGIVYSQTNIIDLQGNVVLKSHDGKKLETGQLYWDRSNKWIFTDGEFTYTNPEDGTVMEGKGMDFNREFTFFNAHRTFGIMTIQEE